MKYLTFILGAGASVAYGLPTGDELIDRLIRTMVAGDLFDSLMGPNERESYRQLGGRLKLYDPLSIDSYIQAHFQTDENAHTQGQIVLKDALELAKESRNKNAQNVHKRFIALEIIESFRGGVLGNLGRSNKQNWIRFIVHELLPLFDQCRKQEPIRECPIKFITFNYDLSFECYFGQIIRQSTIHDLDEQNLFLKWLGESIIHIYGQVGGYHWQPDVPVDQASGWDEVIRKIEFAQTGEVNHQNCISAIWDASRQLASGIGLIGERASEEGLKKAKKWIQKSYSLVLTGYGFNEDNNKLLELSETSKSVEGVICGFWGMSKNKEQDAKDIFNVGLDPSSNTNRTRETVKFRPGSPANYPWIRCYEATTTHQLLKDELTLSKLYRL